MSAVPFFFRGKIKLIYDSRSTIYDWLGRAESCSDKMQIDLRFWLADLKTNIIISWTLIILKSLITLILGGRHFAC